MEQEQLSRMARDVIAEVERSIAANERIDQLDRLDHTYTVFLAGIMINLSKIERGEFGEYLDLMNHQLIDSAMILEGDLYKKLSNVVSAAVGKWRDQGRLPLL
jgi:hypothetical protein